MIKRFTQRIAGVVRYSNCRDGFYG